MIKPQRTEKIKKIALFLFSTEVAVRAFFIEWGQKERERL